MHRVLPLIVLLSLVACSKSAPAQASTSVATANAQNSAVPSATPPAAAGQTALPLPPAKPVPAALPEVLARVNGEDIKKAEFETLIKNMEGRAGQAVPPDQRDVVYRGALEQLIGLKLLVQETKARKMVVPEADIDARIATVKQQFPTEEGFTKALADQHMTVTQLRADLRQNLAVDKLLQDEVAAKVVVKPEDVAAFYQQNPKEFQQPERVRASHILITVPQGADAAAKAAARTKAEGILKSIKAGQDFAAVAKQNSEDPGSAVNGGDLGYFAKGQMVGPFNDVAFTLKPGTMSDLVETQFGFHIIKVVDKQVAGVAPLDDTMRPKIEQFLKARNQQQGTAAFVNALKSKGKVEIFI